MAGGGFFLLSVGVAASLLYRSRAVKMETPMPVPRMQLLLQERYAADRSAAEPHPRQVARGVALSALLPALLAAQPRPAVEASASTAGLASPGVARLVAPVGANRVVGGGAAVSAAAPLSSIVYPLVGSTSCSGVAVTSALVLTAAHCLGSTAPRIAVPAHPGAVAVNVSVPSTFKWVTAVAWAALNEADVGAVVVDPPILPTPGLALDASGLAYNYASNSSLSAAGFGATNAANGAGWGTALLNARMLALSDTLCGYLGGAASATCLADQGSGTACHGDSGGAIYAGTPAAPTALLAIIDGGSQPVLSRAGPDCVTVAFVWGAKVAAIIGSLASTLASWNSNSALKLSAPLAMPVTVTAEPPTPAFVNALASDVCTCASTS